MVVSGPSRGMGGFLHLPQELVQVVSIKRFPAPSEVWVVSFTIIEKAEKTGYAKFPAPLEVWVVSYVLLVGRTVEAIEFPAPLEGWVVSSPICCIPKGNQHTR